LGQPRFECFYELSSPFVRIDHRAQCPDHIEDPGYASLIERMDVQSTANEIGDDIRL
jgi:hypothetical protein